LFFGKYIQKKTEVKYEAKLIIPEAQSISLA